MTPNECSGCHSEDVEFFETTAYDGEPIQLCELCYSSPLGFRMTHSHWHPTIQEVMFTIAMSHNLLLKEIQRGNAQRSSDSSPPQQLGNVLNSDQNDGVESKKT